MAKITCTNFQGKKPDGFRWSNAYRKLCGKSPAPEYVVRWERGYFNPPGTSHCDTLTAARKEAQSLVAEGRAWASVDRWAENGVSVRAVPICHYERA